MKIKTADIQGQKKEGKKKGGQRKEEEKGKNDKDEAYPCKMHTIENYNIKTNRPRYHLTPPISGPPRLLPIASISSIKMIDGANDLALAKRSFTRDAATPTNICKMKSC